MPSTGRDGVRFVGVKHTSLRVIYWPAVQSSPPVARPSPPLLSDHSCCVMSPNWQLFHADRKLYRDTGQSVSRRRCKRRLLQTSKLLVFRVAVSGLFSRVSDSTMRHRQVAMTTSAVPLQRANRPIDMKERFFVHVDGI